MKIEVKKGPIPVRARFGAAITNRTTPWAHPIFGMVNVCGIS